MTKFFSLSCLLFLFTCLIGEAMAQEIPSAHFSDFGFHQPVKQAEVVHYTLQDNLFQKIETEHYVFNEKGNIERWSKINSFDHTEEHTLYLYNAADRLIEQTTSSNIPEWNSSTHFQYNSDGKLRKSETTTERKTVIKKYSYHNGKLHSEELKDGDYSSTSEYFYTKEGEAYKIITQEEGAGEDNPIHVSLLLSDKTIISYTDPGYFAYSYLYLPLFTAHLSFDKDTEAEKNIMEGIRKFEQEAPTGDIPFNLSQYSAQGMQAYFKNKDDVHLYQLELLERNSVDDVVLVVSVATNQGIIDGMSYKEITYTDGTVSGSTVFNEEDVSNFQTMYEQEFLQ